MELLIDDIEVGERVREDYGDLQSLAMSIDELGLLQPLVVNKERTLIAGARRLEAIKQFIPSMVKVNVVEVDTFGDLVRAIRMEIAENKHRLDLTPTEAVRLTLIYDEAFAQAAKERQGTRTDLQHSAKFAESDKGQTREQLGELVGMSGYTYEKAREVVEAADTEPEKYADLPVKMDMSRKVDGAHKELVKRRRREKLTVLAQEGAAVPDYPDWQTYVGLFYPVMRELPAASVDVIITDPPYSEEFIPHLEDLSAAAKRILKPGGSMLVMAGQYHLPEVYRLLGLHMKYHWTIAYLTPGGQAAQIWPRSVNTFWKPVLWYTNGEYVGEWVGDVCKSDINDNDKTFHELGQSESGMADIIERFTVRGDVILDPCMGAGTTGVVAIRLGRKFIGIDVDGTNVNVARQRIGVLYDDISWT